MDLVGDSAFAHVDLESSLVSPGDVPGVDGEPVVSAVLVSPTDELDGVTTEGLSGLVRVDTALVGEEIFVDGEGSSNGSVFADFALDRSNTADSVGGACVVLVIRVGDVSVGWA